MTLIIINTIGAATSLFGIILHVIRGNFKWIIIFILLFILNMICLAININKSHSQNDSSEMSQPTAKDVYEGKTTLRIVYEDSIPVDTIVVFKKNFK